MKKNVMMRVASVLLVAVLMTTCAISGTFAKYVSDGTATDSARVAKWGVTVTGAADMFKTEYPADDTSASITGGSVVTSNSDKLLAPGTEGTLTKFALTGTPEVAVRVTYTVTNIALDNWTLYDGTTEYCPIVFNINGTTYGTKDTDATVKRATVTALKDTLVAVINDYSNEYEAKTSLSGTATEVLDISWYWSFEGNDANDTVLGNKAAGIDGDGNAITPASASIALTVKCTVTQID